jgi:Excalibur calcium-binding domain
MQGSVGIALVVSAALALASAAEARTFQGTLAITDVGATTTAGTPTMVTANATVTQDCDPVIGSPTWEYCGYFPVVTTVAASAPCARAITASSWVGPLVMSEVAPGTHTFSPSWTEWPASQSGAKRACLYVGDLLVAQADYTVPAPPAPAPVVPAPPASAPVGGTVSPRDYNCANFRYQEDAQAYLLPGDPYRLDADRDGVACEELPRRTLSTSTVSQPAIFLSRAEAARQARRALFRKYGRRWTQGSGRLVTCSVRTSARTVGCRASWRYRGVRYGATVVVQEWPTFYRTTAKITSRRRA